MKKTRKAFSFIEVILVLAIVGLLVTIFVPATYKVYEKVRNDIINDQLAKIEKVAIAYMTEHNISQVSYTTLVNEKKIKGINSVAGEKYDDIIIKKAGGTITLDLPDGQKHYFDY
ncbi:MAG: prepilin-type N-terminal cleavage/methylation domain-containing protein [Opitutales bacterium]|nr:prepilin-type N-terminal cleavage/methylation domain-containing protein [Opitutales bacterium]